MTPGTRKQVDPETKILIIDDDATVQMLIDDYLSARGFINFQAKDGKSGLDLFRAESPDLVLLDLRLPGLDGPEVLTQIYKDSPDTPVIIISGKGTIKDALAALKTGAWKYITKPISDMQILEIAVHNVLERVKKIQKKKKHQKTMEEELLKGSSDLEQRRLELEKAYRTS